MTPVENMKRGDLALVMLHSYSSETRVRARVRPRLLWRALGLAALRCVRLTWRNMACVLFVCLCPWIATGESRFEARANAQVAAHIAEHWKTVLEAETRFDEHGDQSRYHSDVGIVYTGPLQWLDIGVRYRTVFKRIDESDWYREHRYYLDLMARQRVWRLPFSHRVRMEYSEWEDDFVDYSTLRYRFAVNPPYHLQSERERWILRDYKRRFYGSYEVSANTEKEDIVRHQIKVGWSTAFSDTIMGDIYYLWEGNDSEIEDVDLHVAGLSFKVLL